MVYSEFSCLSYRPGGVCGRSAESKASSSSAFILAAVGVLRGSKFSGGNRNGGRFFFAVLG